MSRDHSESPSTPFRKYCTDPQSLICDFFSLVVFVCLLEYSGRRQLSQDMGERSRRGLMSCTGGGGGGGVCVLLVDGGFDCTEITVRKKRVCELLLLLPLLLSFFHRRSLALCRHPTSLSNQQICSFTLCQSLSQFTTHSLNTHEPVVEHDV